MTHLRDSTIISDWYGHPEKGDGQGYYVMFNAKGRLEYCRSGNELRRIYNLDPSKWMTGPIFLPLSVEDCTRVIAYEERLVDNF